ncbi:MAG: ftsA [Gammaproteobacteria bacterium]|jgi:cell division protein FtsA|nr:ftsA [Gammaproteobacteria bacterium]
MLRKSPQNLIVALDVGTSKIAALVGEISSEGQIEVIGIGSHPSHGLKRGVVVNIEATVQSIQRAIEEAELMAGCEIHSAFTGIAGNHVRSLNSHGMIAIRDKEVSSNDVERVLDAARALAIPADQTILHILPQEYSIDNQEGIREPIGMSGVRLEARVHIVTGATSSAQNLTKCVERCGLQVEDMILEQLASSQAVLTEDEKDLGVCMVDIGGGTTDIAIFAGGSIRHSAVIPIAGDQVTNDIAVALRTTTKYAENMKIKYGSVLIPGTGEDTTMIEVPGATGRPPRKFSRKMLAEVIGARYEELFSLIHAELQRSGFGKLVASGIVLTGGASQMKGAIDLAESVFQIPARLGTPQHVKGLTDILSSPIYATSVGLLLYSYQRQYEGRPELIIGNSMKGMWGRIKNWFQGNF